MCSPPPGKPPKYDVEELISTIARIVLSGSATHERRRNEVVRSVKTLDDLTDAFQEDGFNLSRSGVYLPLLPRYARSKEGKRHVTTAPVKLARAQNNQHANHEATKFTRCSMLDAPPNGRNCWDLRSTTSDLPFTR